MAPSHELVTGVWQHPQVAAPAPVGLGPANGRCHQRAAVHPGDRIGKPCRRPVDRRRAVASLTYRVGQRDQIVLIRVRRQRPRMANQFPTARRRDSARVGHAQIPRMRLRHGGQGPDDGRRIGVDEGQRRDRIVGAPGPAAATGNVHAREAIARKPPVAPDTRSRGEADLQPLRSVPRTRGALMSPAERNLRGSRRGREMRGPLLPPTVPGWRSRAERFDMAVLEAYEPIERRWQDRVSGLDVAVDEIPRISPKDPDVVQWPPEVVADGPIALARLIPAGVDVRGNATRARIVLFRKPIERRAKDTIELAELLHEVLVAQVATYLGVEPSVIDPTIDDE